MTMMGRLRDRPDFGEQQVVVHYIRLLGRRAVRRIRKDLVFYSICSILVTLIIICRYILLDIPGDNLTHSKFTRFFYSKETNNQVSFSIQPNLVCSSMPNSILQIVVVVVSKATNADRRKSIRQTWGNTDLQNKYRLRIYFLVGQMKDLGLEEENDRHGDIIQAHIEEDYYKLTEKTMAAFQWASQFCPNEAFFFKCDDDTFVNIKRLSEVVNSPGLPSNTVVGRCVFGGNPNRESDKSQFSLFFQDYPFKTFPPYCSGSGYLLSMDTAKTIFHGMKTTAYFPFEDVFVGIVSYKMEVKVTHMETFGYDYKDHTTYREKIMLYFYRTCAVVIHKLRGDDHYRVWQQYSKYLYEPESSYC